MRKQGGKKKNQKNCYYIRLTREGIYFLNIPEKQNTCPELIVAYIAQKKKKMNRQNIPKVTNDRWTE